MSLSPLEALPTELVHRICDCIDDQDKVNLKAFSLTSKTCYAATLPCVYHTICLRVPRALSIQAQGEESPQYRQDVRTSTKRIMDWQRLVARDKAHRHVLCVKVSEPRQQYYPYGPLRSQEASDLLDSDDEFADPPERDPDTSYFHYITGLRLAQEGGIKDEPSLWSVLADFVQQLPALRDFHFDCSYPLARSLCKALTHVGCNVHLDRFMYEECFRDYSLPQRVPIPSVHLAGIRILASCCYNAAGEVWARESIESLFTRSYAALETISLINDHKTSNFVETKVPDEFWSNSVPYLEAMTSMGRQPKTKLRSLEVGGTGPHWWIAVLDALVFHCDLSELDILKLRIPYRHVGLRSLIQHNVFESLTTLVIGVDGERPVGREEVEEQDLSIAFLRSLQPLRALRLVEQVTAETIEVIMARHGATLQRLWFPPARDRAYHENAVPNYFDADSIAALVSRCLNLQDLALTISRSMGDAKEVHLYRELSELLNLKRLMLYLDCEDTTLDLGITDDEPTKIYPSFDEFDKEFCRTRSPTRLGHNRKPRNGHIRVAMINAALDERLARSILATISDSRAATPGARMLEHLELRPIRGQYTEETSEVIKTIGLWWQLERSQRDDSRDRIEATRLCHPGDVLTTQMGPPKRLSRQAETIFRKIWRDAGKNWSEEWSSWPLDTEAYEQVDDR